MPGDARPTPQTPKTQEEPAVRCESQDGKTSVAAPGSQAEDALCLVRGPALWLKQAFGRWEGAHHCRVGTPLHSVCGSKC